MPRTLAGTGGAAAPAPPAVPVFDLQLLVLGEEDAGRFSRDPLSVEQLRPGKPGRFQHADHKASSVVPLASVVGAKHAEDHYQPLATQHFGLTGDLVVIKRLGRRLRLGRRIVGEDRLQPLLLRRSPAPVALSPSRILGSAQRRRAATAATVRTRPGGTADRRERRRSPRWCADKPRRAEQLRQVKLTEVGGLQCAPKPALDISAQR